jgi:hypothetical protein
MSKNEFKLSIDNPCSQEWQTMSPAHEGRFCSNCSQSVIDFTHHADAELLEAMNRSQGRLCGRLRESQLNRPIYPARVKKQSNWLKWLTGLFLLNGFNQLSAANQHTVNLSWNSEQSVIDKEQKKEKKKNKVHKDTLKKILQGTILDSATRKPLAYATVIIRDTKTRASTDTNGKFQIIIPEYLQRNLIYIDISSVGYQQVEFTIPRKKSPANLEVLLQTNEDAFMGEVIITRKRKWWQRKKS